MHASTASLVGISLALAPGHACYIPLRHKGAADPTDDLLSLNAPTETIAQCDFDEAMALLKPLCENPAILKIGHNLKYDFHVLLARKWRGYRL